MLVEMNVFNVGALFFGMMWAELFFGGVWLFREDGGCDSGDKSGGWGGYGGSCRGSASGFFSLLWRACFENMVGAKVVKKVLVLMWWR